MSLVKPDASYKVESFAPGFQDTPEPDRLVPGATPDAKNCLFTNIKLDADGVSADLAKRPGCRLVTPAALIASTRFDALVEFRLPGQVAGTLLAALGGKVYTFDNIDTFTAIGATTPFVAGTQVRTFVFRNLLFLMDGISSRCWDGALASDLFTPGVAAPTSAPTLTDGGASTLTAGTFEGYAVWYDSTHDHPSSPSAISAQLVLAANRSRNWAKPTGAPGANYDRWRVYCRRVDTNEVYFKRVVDTAIGTASVTEVVTDAARNLAELGPLPNQNDAPPAFALMAEYQGYALGVKRNDDQVWVSRSGDAQSQNAKDVIPVVRGSGGEIRSIRAYREEVLIQKASRSYRFENDRMPFLPRQIHSAFGNVGQDSGMEVEKLWYAWDQDKGPYVTDLVNWTPLAAGRIERFLATVNKSGLSEIVVAHYKPLNLVIWAVPTGGSQRRRTLLAYNYVLHTWLPPITGLEYAALTQFQTPAGELVLYVGDYWGRLYQYFVGTNEGVPGGTVIATSEQMPVPGDVTHVKCPTAAFYTTGAGLAGQRVLVISPAGVEQWRRIASNTATIILLEFVTDAPFDERVPTGYTVVVGAIEWYWRSGLATFGDSLRQKRGGFLAVEARSGSSPFALLTLGFQDSVNTVRLAKSFDLAQTGALWGAGLWGVMLWGGAVLAGIKARIGRSFFSFAFQLKNPYPDQPVEITRAAVGADFLPRRLVRSGGTDQPTLIGGAS